MFKLFCHLTLIATIPLVWVFTSSPGFFHGDLAIPITIVDAMFVGFFYVHINTL